MRFAIFAIMLMLVFGCIDLPSKEEIRQDILNNMSNQTNETIVIDENPASVEDILNFSLKTNTYEYKSGENMICTVEITSDRPVQNAWLRVQGIKNTHGSYLMNKNQYVDLKEGENIFTVSYKIPQCSSCTGLRRGNNFVEAGLYHGEKLLALDTEAVLVK